MAARPGPADGVWWGMKTFVAAIDLSPVTKQVVATAAELAQASRATVVLCTVLVEPVYLADSAAVVEGLAKVTVRRSGAVRRQLAAIRRHLEAAGLKVLVSVRRGVPGEEILREVTQRKATRLIIGSHGHSAWRELLTGRTASSLLRRARCPVVVVPAPRPARRRRRRGLPMALYFPWSITP